MKKRLDFIYRKLKKMSLRCVEPEGAMYAYPELPKGEDIPIVEKLLEKGVALAPGSGFGDSYKRFVRISACQPEKMLEKGLAGIGHKGANVNAKVAIVGAAGKMGSWFTSYFAQRGLDVLAYDINQKMLLLKDSSKVKVQKSLRQCVQDADFTCVCACAKDTTGHKRMRKKHEGWGDYCRNILSKKQDMWCLKKIPINLRPLCIHPMFGPGASKNEEARVLLVPVRNEKIELKIANEIFENANVKVLPDASIA